jgi:hypothetical protein
MKFTDLTLDMLQRMINIINMFQLSEVDGLIQWIDGDKPPESITFARLEARVARLEKEMENG